MTRSLSFHSRYRCANSGACCTAGWPIAIEPDRLARVRTALSENHLAARVPEPLGKPDATGSARLAADHAGCAFYHPPARRCAIHRALGHSSLPLACRQFPRISLRDPRGVSVTLSHYCPTAARLLETDDEVSVVADPPAFPADGEYVGLDASQVLPPLLRPGILMDWDAWGECERLAVELVGNFPGAPQAALARVYGVVAAIQEWTPDGADPLVERVRTAFVSPVTLARLPPRPQLLAAARTAIPADLRPPMQPPTARPQDAIVNRFLAAHLFANWKAYGPGGLDDWLRSVATAHALIESGFTVRDADLWLRHLAQ